MSTRPFKTLAAYKFSEKFQKKFSYLDIDNYSKNKNLTISVMNILSIL